MGIVVFGAVFVDIKGYPLGQFSPTGRNVGRVMTVHGGVSRNVAEDIGNVELRPTFVSVVDDNGTGEDVLAKLRRHKINVDYCVRKPEGIGTWLVVFDNTGDVAASISQRPDLSAIGDLLEEKGDEIISGCDSVVVEIDLDPPVLKKIFELADKYKKDVYAVVSNMSIAMKRRDLLSRTACVVCNQEEAGLLFTEDYREKTPDEMQVILTEKLRMTTIPRMIVTMGGNGAVYAENDSIAKEEGQACATGYVPALGAIVQDTTGCGDAFFSGVAIGLTYGKTLRESCEIGTRLAASVIATKENVCPRFKPEEFGLELPPHLQEAN